jgi:hypothetical protein
VEAGAIGVRPPQRVSAASQGSQGDAKAHQRAAQQRQHVWVRHAAHRHDGLLAAPEIGLATTMQISRQAP